MNNRVASTVAIVFLLNFAPRLFAQESQVDSLLITPLNAKKGVTTLYQVDFVPRDTIPSDAQFHIEFPEEFDLSAASLAGSKTMNGGFFVFVDGKKLAIGRKGEGKRVVPGQVSNLLFSIIINPATAKSNYQLRFQILNSNGDTLTQLQSVNVSIEN
jgi:hypothetical protein